MTEVQNAALEKAREIIGEHFDDIVIVGRISDIDGEAMGMVSNTSHFMTLGLLEAAADDIRAQISCNRQR